MLDLHRVDDLLMEWESAWRTGRPVTPDELCPDWPEGLAELRRRTELLRQFEVFSAGDTITGHYAGPDAPPAIPGYAMRGELGKGGMGVVYRAWQEELGREVAVKVMRGGPDIPAHVARRFAQEARLLARLKHDYLVPVYEAEFNRGQPYFVMELVAGGSLADSLARYAADPKGAALLVEQVARAVHYAHDQGVLHRDLKPANILLDEQGRPRVSDFGLAKLFGDDAEETVEFGPGQPATGHITLSLSGGLLGTPPYMAPEQFRGDREAITRRTDVWALGVILYEMLTGQRPFGGNYAKSVCDKTPLPPRTLVPKLDRGLEAVILQCLAKDPVHRYATAAELADDLARCRQGQAPKALRESWRRQLLRGVRRRRAVAVVGLLTAAALVLWGVAGYVTNPQRAQDQIRRDLNDGKLVTLVSALGPPAHFGWGQGQERTKVSTEGDREFFVSTLSTGLVELWHDPPPAFILRAEVRHEDTASDGYVGVYFDYRGPEPSAPRPCCYVVGFADIGQIAHERTGPNGVAGSRVQTTFHYFSPQPGLEPFDHRQLVDNGLFYVPPPWRGGPGIWRTLEIHVSPRGLTVYWIDDDDNGKAEPAGAVTPQEFVRCAGDIPRVSPDMKGYTFDPQTRGPIGLYVYNSAASFRNVTLQRVKTEP